MNVYIGSYTYDLRVPFRNLLKYLYVPAVVRKFYSRYARGVRTPSFVYVRSDRGHVVTL